MSLTKHKHQIKLFSKVLYGTVECAEAAITKQCNIILQRDMIWETISSCHTDFLTKLSENDRADIQHAIQTGTLDHMTQKDVS